MRIVLRDRLLFVTVTIAYGGREIEVSNVLLDTGAASTVINADIAGELGIFAQRTDRLRELRGVGGHEYVFVRELDRIIVDARTMDHFEVDIGEVDYGVGIDGILGMDFLIASRAIIDLSTLELRLS